jgi:hypothetical protein
MNLEGIFALGFLALLLTRDQHKPATGGWRGDLLLASAIAALVIAGFSSALDFPFLADDYIHIWNARHADWRALLAHFTVPEPDRFFRPAVYCSYALDALWAGLSPVAWRASNLAIHALNVLLLYWLCRDLRFARAGAFLGALIFGLHGSRPEAVTWVAARFDLLAVTFGLATLIAILHGVSWWMSAGLLALAIMSKESAYVVPLLAAISLRFVGIRWQEIGKRCWALFATASAAIAYRLWLLHGIGGYRDPSTGSPVVLHFSFASTLNALFLRFWAALLFPLNWTGGLGKLTGLFLAAAIASMLYLAWRGTERRKVVFGIGVAFICALPVHQFLSIGMDLEKSRVLYFSSVGLAFLFAALFEHMDWKLPLCAVAIVGFQWSALQNNLYYWKEVGELAGRTCAAQARLGRSFSEPLPNVIDGVYFLRMGFPECVKFHDPSAEVVIGQASLPARTAAWDPQTRTLH